jgi:hypothetical protein
VRFLVRSILAVNALGAVTALRQRRPARFAGISLPGPPVLQALTIGSSMSAPPIMLGLLVVGARRGRTDIVRSVAALFVLGILGEPDTWRALRRPSSDPVSAACVVLEIVLPATLLRDAAPSRSRAA